MTVLIDKSLLASLDLLDSASAFRGFCPICYNEDRIMSVVLKKPMAEMGEWNSTNVGCLLHIAHTLMYIDIISSQHICFLCALQCQRSIFHENLSAILPTVEYQGVNKAYMDHQLASTFSGGVPTEETANCQIFVKVLLCTLETKSWCGDQAHGEESQRNPDIWSRRQALSWVLRTFMSNCRIFKTVEETGQHVDYRSALTWVVQDFRRFKRESWLIRYPPWGFSQIIGLFNFVDLKLRVDTEEMIMTKLLQMVVTKIRCLHIDKGCYAYDKIWKLIYRSANTPDAPQDHGSASLVTVDMFWSSLKEIMGNSLGMERFLQLFSRSAKRRSYKRVQIIAFWALHNRSFYTPPRDYFQRILDNLPLEPDVFEVTNELPESSVDQVLLSLFCPRNRPKSAHSIDFVPPFVSPWGPSVVKCGDPDCHVKFYSDTDPLPLDPKVLHRNRTQHLKEVFGVAPEFMASKNGMPERTFAPKPPTSTHYSLHRSVITTWEQLSYSAKYYVLTKNEKAVELFVSDTINEACKSSSGGNIYKASIPSDVKKVLPSFFDALRVASEKQGLWHPLGVLYKHRCSQGSFEARLAYELSL